MSLSGMIGGDARYCRFPSCRLKRQVGKRFPPPKSGGDPGYAPTVILSGFKSIRAMDLELRPAERLIGANGAGKTNLVSFFEMLRHPSAPS